MSRPSDPLLRGLVDDAALFPPGNAPMDVALAEHAGHRGAWYADMVGPFLAPASRVDELLAVLPADQRVGLSIVVDVSAEPARDAFRRAVGDVRLTAVEASHARLGNDATAVGAEVGGLAGVTGFLEVPQTDADAALDLVGTTGWYAAKYRTGGITADASPSEVQLAGFLVAAAARAIPFKLTAGLHHAVRNTDPATAFEQHGVLNVLVATRVAQQGGGVAEVAAVLAQREPDPLVAFVQAWDEGTALDVRRSFRSFGCCGVTDPIDDLVALGVLEGAR